MKFKVFVSLALTTIIYSVSIIIGLILRFSLIKVFSTGLLISTFTGLSVYIIITGIEKYLDKKVEVDKVICKDNDKADSEESPEDGSPDGFSPLNPPILELEKETPD